MGWGGQSSPLTNHDHWLTLNLTVAWWFKKKKKKKVLHLVATHTQRHTQPYIKTSLVCRIRFAQRWDWGSHSGLKELYWWKDWLPVTHGSEMNWTETLRHEHTCCTFTLPAECPLCARACVCESPALPCQNATCSSWLQLNGKLEILTVDLVVHKLVENVFQGGAGYLTVSPPRAETHSSDGGVYQLKSAPPLPSPLLTCSLAVFRGNTELIWKNSAHKSQASQSIREVGPWGAGRL